MGLFDRIHVTGVNYVAGQAPGGAEALRAAFPPGTELPRRDYVPLSRRFMMATVEAYIATLGLKPDDIHAVIPQQGNDVDIGYYFIYRDRPEFEAGRAAWAAAEG